MVVYLSNNLKQEKYWPFATTVNEFFFFKNQLHILDYSGQIFVKSGDDWRKTSLKVSPRSHIFFNDTFLIACHSRSDFKEGKEAGGCESPEKKWSFTLNWIFVPPKVCNQRLTLRVFSFRPPFEVVQFDMERGKELARKSVKQNITDVCSVKFD